MNPFYHEFTIGFNFWMIYVVVAVVVAAFVGVKNYRLEKREIVKNWSDKQLAYITMTLTVVFVVMLVVESMDGIVQYSDNHLAVGEPGALSLLVGAPMIILFSAAVFWAVLCLVVYIAGLARVGWLYNRAQEARLREAQRERERFLKVEHARRAQERRFQDEARRNVERNKRRQSKNYR